MRASDAALEGASPHLLIPAALPQPLPRRRIPRPFRIHRRPPRVRPAPTIIASNLWQTQTRVPAAIRKIIAQILENAASTPSNLWKSRPRFWRSSSGNACLPHGAGAHVVDGVASAAWEREGGGWRVDHVPARVQQQLRPSQRALVRCKALLVSEAERQSFSKPIQRTFST